MRTGILPIAFPRERRLAYYDAFDAAHVDGNYGPFLNLISELAEKTFDPYRHTLGIEKEN